MLLRGSISRANTIGDSAGEEEETSNGERSAIDSDNVITITLEDLSEDGRWEIEREL